MRKKRKTALTEIAMKHSRMDYQQLYEYIVSEIEKGNLQPVKASKLNGKKPALYNAYWVLEEEKDYLEIKEEMTYKISPFLDMSYYQIRPEKYLCDRNNILLLSNYLMGQRNLLEISETVNERSFEIFCREKFLKQEGGKELLKRLGISIDKLNIYQTSEPMSYYSHQKKVPQNFLIIENKDSFCSMRKHLISGNDTILGMQIGTLIYGAGKGIYKSFEDYMNAVEPYFNHHKNMVYYFGDLDYEGILIYEWLVQRYQEKVEIKLFSAAYRKMLKKAERLGENLPKTKKGQNQNIGMIFLQQFLKEEQTIIRKLLEQGKYIPQEILNQRDY